MNATGFKLLRISTDALPARDRIPFRCDEFARVALKATFDPIVGHQFRQAGAFYAFDDLGISFGETNGFRSWRDKAQLADSNDDLILNINVLGYSLASQVGRELKIASGAAALLTCGELLSHHVPERCVASAFAYHADCSATSWPILRML
jgi:hypothetical protein